jgi:glycosyltransferase involved in cell wall biosynthesis
MKILFLDQSGKIGGAELSLLDVARPYRDRCLVGLFQDGPYRQLLEQHQISVEILTNQSIAVSKDSSVWQSLSSLKQLLPLVMKVASLSRAYDFIYTNTQKAFVIGAFASFLSRKPLIYHLRDILSADHFSSANLRLAIALANRCATLVIANSHATKAAFIAAGGRPDIIQVVYNGFQPTAYQSTESVRQQLRQDLGIETQFVIGHFSRLSPWKGQHILIEALKHCPETTTIILVGDALFGEQDYVKQLHQQVEALGLNHRVKFLGFRSDIPQLMAACDLVAHTSTAPEPFGRVIVEAMLCKRPVVVAEAGGAVELVEPGKTGWLVPPNNPPKLAEVINQCHTDPEQTTAIAHEAFLTAQKRFHLDQTNQEIAELLQEILM